MHQDRLVWWWKFKVIFVHSFSVSKDPNDHAKMSRMIRLWKDRKVITEDEAKVLEEYGLIVGLAPRSA